MADDRNVTLDTRRYVTVAANLLHAAFIKAPRAQAKRHFARLHGGNPLDLAKLTFGERGEVQFRVDLDFSEYRGKIGFPVFRAALQRLLGQLGQRVRLKQDIPVLASEQTGQILFAVPAFVQDEGQVNVLMLGVGKAEPGVTTLRLQYLDPEQFRKPAEAPAAAS
jgi:hypothetical protein